MDRVSFQNGFICGLAIPSAFLGGQQQLPVSGIAYSIKNVSFARIVMTLSGKSEMIIEPQGTTETTMAFMDPDGMSGVIAGAVSLHSKF